ncbi:hypothetical protein PPTG_24010 [Phytophthora nicotianae INRA-310]|uniref:Uncharacterized protein n=1 Tax=Phytophthora nicotianae (strain INRA-310) TaxID=761204 RepID=W2PMJ2_PHYN3|nr:hypothetical protein PPTG_24010 [Phytophthora nicotianae INRA-310]ETN01816.1 hypothetical protein PPTG_24010 [Phytophthora nicotianae INRA-310]
MLELIFGRAKIMDMMLHLRESVSKKKGEAVFVTDKSSVPKVMGLLHPLLVEMPARRATHQNDQFMRSVKRPNSCTDDG